MENVTMDKALADVEMFEIYDPDEHGEDSEHFAQFVECEYDDDNDNDDEELASISNELEESINNNIMEQQSEEEQEEQEDHFGIKIVKTESLLEQDESEGDSDSYHEYYSPEVEIEEAVPMPLPIPTVRSTVPRASRAKPRPIMPKPEITEATFYERLTLTADMKKPNILMRKPPGVPLPQHPQKTPTNNKNIRQVQIPPPPPLVRRPSLHHQNHLHSPRKVSLESILRETKPMPRLQPKMNIRTENNINPTRLPSFGNRNIVQKTSTINRVVASGSGHNGDSNGNGLRQNIQTLNGARPKRNVPRCNICNKTFATIPILERHKSLHEDVHKCPVCNRRFNDPFLLSQHVKIHKKGSALQCRVCYRNFSTIDSLHIHMVIHEGNYRCRGCRKGFPDRETLEEHEATHKRYSCEWCGKTFMNSGNLKAHERIHTGERPFKCKDCPKAFKQLGGLQYHLKANLSHRPVS